MRFLRPYRLPRLIFQRGRPFRLGASSKIGVIQWYPKRKKKR